MMNAGYVSFVLAVIALILFASGWKDVLIRGITRMSLLLFFMSWLATLGVNVWWGEIRMFGPGFVLSGMTLYMLARTRGGLLKFHLLSVTLLLSALYVLLSEMLHLMPLLIVMNPSFTIALVSGVLAGMLLRLPAMQLAALAGGLLLGEGLGVYVHRGSVQTTLGSASLMDLWWMSAFVARGGSLALELLLSSLRKAYRALSDVLRWR
jgi:hypothetical protein